MRFSLLAVAASVLALPLAAHADLLGDSVHVTYDFPTSTATFFDLGDFTVPGAGNASTIASFTINPSHITITDSVQQTFANSDFNGFEFTDISRDPGITGVTLDPLSTFSGGQITFTTDEIFINFEGAGLVNPGQTAIFDITFAPPAPSVAPEPSSIALMGTGLLGVAGMMRRRFVRS